VSGIARENAARRYVQYLKVSRVLVLYVGAGADAPLHGELPADPDEDEDDDDDDDDEHTHGGITVRGCG